MLPNFTVVICGAVLTVLMLAVAGSGLIDPQTRTRIGAMPEIGRPMMQRMITEPAARGQFAAIETSRRAEELMRLRDLAPAVAEPAPSAEHDEPGQPGNPLRRHRSLRRTRRAAPAASAEAESPAVVEAAPAVAEAPAAAAEAEPAAAAETAAAAVAVGGTAARMAEAASGRDCGADAADRSGRGAGPCWCADTGGHHARRGTGRRLLRPRPPIAPSAQRTRGHRRVRHRGHRPTRGTRGSRPQRAPCGTAGLRSAAIGAGRA